MAEYILYLDETKFQDPISKDQLYGIAGLAIEKSNLKNMRTQLGTLKKELWSSKMRFSEAKNIVLHATDVRSANNKFHPCYSIFNKASNKRLLFNRVGEIIKSNDMIVFGCVVNLGILADEYKSNHTHYTGDKICLTKVINNFTCFLKWHNSRGSIVFESRYNHGGDTTDRKLRKQFYKIISQGTNLYSALELQSTIEGISFIKKQENDAGLQLADFVPTPFMLNYCGKQQTKPSIYPILKQRRYSGNTSFGEKNSKKFGVCYYN